MDENVYTADMAMAKASVYQLLNQSKPKPRPHRNCVEETIQWRRRTCYIPAKILSNLRSDAHCCNIPFEELKPIKLREMEVPKIHHGRYLVCKIVGKPIANLGVHILVEDLNGDVEEASFYNFRYNLDDIDWISVGAILVVKEPRFQCSLHSNTPFLRIDSPSDVIFVDPTDEEFLDKIGAKKWYESASKDAEVWRQKANEYFKNGKYEKALFLYDRGIRCNPDLAVLYLNKALTFLKIGAFHDAYESAKLGLEKGGDKEKALYRLGQAAYGMREWQKSAKHFCEVLKEFPQNFDASKELKRATDRLKEEKTGKFDFKSMFIESKKERNSKLDVADYIGPIEISNIPGKGRGIIASTDIQKGTLLVVSKSIGSGYAQDVPQSLSANINSAGKNSRSLTQVLQAIDTIQYLQNNPQRAKEIYELYTRYDTVKAEEIPDSVIDAARLENISSFNRFDNVDKQKTDCSHLFILPSYFNHSCLANAIRKLYGDVMIIRACADIKKGEEIFLGYFTPLEEYSIRKKKCGEHYFTCQCKLCEIDSNDELCAKRHQILEECFHILKNLTCLKDDFKRCEKLIKKIRQTYTKRSEFKTVLAQMLEISYDLAFNVDYRKFVEYLEELTTVADGYLSYAINMPRVYYLLESIYSAAGNTVKAKEMMQKALETSFCTDIEHFKMVYPDL